VLPRATYTPLHHNKLTNLIKIIIPHEKSVPALLLYNMFKPSELCAKNNYITYLLTYLLTYSMEQSPFWEANRSAACQEIPCILWNPKVHYRIHKRPPPVPVLNQL